MTHKVKPIPEGYRSVTPYLVVRDAARAMEFYREAFGAEEIFRMPGPDGRTVLHAEMKLGDSMLMLSDESSGGTARSPESLRGTSASVFLYLPDVDATFRRALAAGATPLAAPADMFWGDRFGKLRDPFGHEWGLATHIEDVSPLDLGRRAMQAFGSPAKP